MKTRLGFVSNSSSTSFYIDASKYSENQVISVIGKLIETLKITEQNLDYTVDDICCISIKDKQQLKESLRCTEDWFKKYYYNLIETIDRYKDNIIVIDSNEDNSIPYEIQEFIENHFNAYRQHWG